MSIIGIDFGSHKLSIALYHDDKDLLEVIADDIGSRTIPCCVAYRNDEILTGLAALSQQHKNLPNTFDNIRAKLLLNVSEQQMFYVAALEKDVSTTELGSNFFRNVSNQVKQQVGKTVKNCILTLPDEIDDESKTRIIKSAQDGGLRVKAIISEAVSVLLAYRMDEPSIISATAMVIDFGWSKTEISLFRIRNGIFYPCSKKRSHVACGADVVRFVAEHCAKDFLRRTKVPCIDNKKAMLRLTRECETAIKSLSTATEANINLDSLCEGVDYSSKLSRARFEDLCLVPLTALRALVDEAINAVEGLQPTDVTHVCLAGGMVSVPKVLSQLKTSLPSAVFLKSRTEPSESQCIGAAEYGKSLQQNSLLELPPQISEPLPCLSRALLLSGSFDPSAAPVPLLPMKSVLPQTLLVRTLLPPEGAVISVFAGPETGVTDTSSTALGRLIIPSTTNPTSTEPIAVQLEINVSKVGVIRLSAMLSTNPDVILSSVEIVSAIV